MLRATAEALLLKHGFRKGNAAASLRLRTGDTVFVRNSTTLYVTRATGDPDGTVIVALVDKAGRTVEAARILRTVAKRYVGSHCILPGWVLLYRIWDSKKTRFSVYRVASNYHKEKHTVSDDNLKARIDAWFDGPRDDDEGAIFSDWLKEHVLT